MDWLKIGWQSEVVNSQVKIEVVKFANGEIKPVIKEPERLRGRKVWLKVEYYPNINYNLMLTFLVVDAVKRIGVEKLRLEAIWFPYSPQNQVFKAGEPLSMELVVKLLEAAGVDEFRLWDLHHLGSLDFFSKPVAHFSFLPLFAKELKPLIDKDWLVISPDFGGRERAKQLASLLGVKWGYIEKVRDRDDGSIKVGNLLGVEVKNKNIVLIDDFSATGSTILKSIAKLKARQAREIIVCLGYLLMPAAVFREIEEKGQIKKWLIGSRLV